MNDRKLLELAAKAAGIKLVFDPHGMPRDCTGLHEQANILAAPIWTSLDNDGDALRLAVKLNLTVGIECESAGAVSIEWDFNDSGVGNKYLHEPAPIGGDDYAATRRAITRAAAEMSEGK